MISKIFNFNKILKATTSIMVATAVIFSGFFTYALAEGETDSEGSEVIEEAALPTYGTTALLSSGPDINAAGAIVMDINSGTVLYSKNETTAFQPSSLTKLLTAYVCFNKLKMNDIITCSLTAATQDFSTAANIGYDAEETYTVYDALRGSIMASAEDSTYSICEKIAGTMPDFAVLMNSYGSELGFVNSNFVNGMGKYDDGQYSCCYDMALTAAALMRNYPNFKTIASSKAAAFTGGYVVSNSHRFVYGTDTCDYAYAGKTGGTAFGGDGTWSLCTFASYQGINAVCIIMGSPSNDKSYADTKTLFSYVFDNYKNVSVGSILDLKADDIGLLFNQCPLFEKSSDKSIFYNPKATVIMPNDVVLSEVTHSIKYNQIDEYSYGNNNIGKVHFYYNDKWAGQADIFYYTEDASMQASEFYKSFPTFLINPDFVTESDLFIVKDFGPTGEKPTFFNKLKAGALSLYTPAKSFSAVVALGAFVIGALLIYLLYPIKKAPKVTKYAKNFDNAYDKLPDDELSEVRRNRRRGSGDMTEMK